MSEPVWGRCLAVRVTVYLCLGFFPALFWFRLCRPWWSDCQYVLFTLSARARHEPAYEKKTQAQCVFNWMFCKSIGISELRGIPAFLSGLGRPFYQVVVPSDFLVNAIWTK